MSCPHVLRVASTATTAFASPVAGAAGRGRRGTRHARRRLRVSRIVRSDAADAGGEVGATDATAEPTEKKTGFTNKDAFKALEGLGGKAAGGGFRATSAADPFGGGAAANPFAMPNAAVASKPVGFRGDDVDVAGLPAKADADRLLMRFDRDQRKGCLPGADTPEGSPQCTHPPLRASCRALAAASSRVMMGICAPDAASAVAALKAWTADLGLPRGMLHGLDVDGVAVEPPEGPVFIKYNSDSGDAFLSGYGGEYRGVLFTPELGDGAFRQYGYLPLDLPAGGKC